MICTRIRNFRQRQQLQRRLERLDRCALEHARLLHSEAPLGERRQFVRHWRALDHILDRVRRCVGHESCLIVLPARSNQPG